MGASNPLPSEPVGGRYELLEPAGEGNFSITYRARDLILGRTVAVKMLRAQYAADPTFVSRFEREARVAASVSHPNVVDVYDFGPYHDTFYIVMQYVPGRTLKQELDLRGRFEPADAVRTAAQILGGLAAIHAAGIVHRDIKPQNVLLGRDAVARVTDFGVAHYPLHGSLTSHGTTVGTASYMAPEQARGGALSEATDLYAVGIVLFELLTGRLPFAAGNPMAVMLAHLQQPPPRPRDVAPEAAIPPALEAEVMGALAKDPRQRHASAEDMSRALEAAIVAAPALGEPGATVADLGTVQMPAAATPPLGTTRTPSPVAAGATPGQPAATPQVRSAPPMLRRRRRRSPAAWLAPVVLFGLALAGIGGLFASGGLPGLGGEDGGRPTSMPAAGIVDATETPPAVTATPTPTVRAISIAPRVTATPRSAPRPTTVLAAMSTPAPTSAPEPTLPPPATPTPTPTPTATAAPEPTTAPEPLPTNTPEPTATTAPPPTEIPDPTPTPVPVVLDPDGVSGGTDEDSDAEGEPPAVVPDAEPPSIESVDQEGEAAPGGETLQFGAGSWSGGMPVNAGMYGRSAVAIYGSGGAYGRAALNFELGAEPAGGAVLTITGLGDEWADVYEFQVEVNGTAAARVTNPFPDWTPTADPAGQWSQLPITIPGGLLRDGQNEIAIVSLVSGAHVGQPPYVLLADASLATGAETAGRTGRPRQVEAEVQSNEGRQESDGRPGRGGNGNGNGNSGQNRGSGGKDDKGDD